MTTTRVRKRNNSGYIYLINPDSLRFGHLGNGITVFTTDIKTSNNDYMTIAHISKGRVIEWRKEVDKDTTEAVECYAKNGSPYVSATQSEKVFVNEPRTAYKRSKTGKECKYCRHAIYYSRPLKAWRCGPSCDRAEPQTSILDESPEDYANRQGMPRALPTIEYLGETYTIDERLQEIRANLRPWESTPFRNIIDPELKTLIERETSRLVFT